MEHQSLNQSPISPLYSPSAMLNEGQVQQQLERAQFQNPTQEYPNMFHTVTTKVQHPIKHASNAEPSAETYHIMPKLKSEFKSKKRLKSKPLRPSEKINVTLRTGTYQFKDGKIITIKRNITLVHKTKLAITRMM